MIWFLGMLIAQAGIDAGPAKVSCDGSVVTLQAFPINPPANFQIQWEDGSGPGVFLVVNPTSTASYRVSLTDLDTNEVFWDETRVVVHPGSADLFSDGQFDGQDWAVFFANWGGLPPEPDFDPDGDGLVTLLDWFYLCNFEVAPPNTPPELTIADAETLRDETVIIPFMISDAEQTPQLQIGQQAANGTALLLMGELRYIPNPGFVGNDSFQVFVTDGFINTPMVQVNVAVQAPETWSDLFTGIFFLECKACHIDASSGGLSLSTYALAQAGGNSGAGFVAGNPNASPIFLRVSNGSMPLGRPPLSAEDVERIRLWILRGAEP